MADTPPGRQQQGGDRRRRGERQRPAEGVVERERLPGRSGVGGELPLARDPIPDSTLVEIADQVFLPLVRAR